MGNRSTPVTSERYVKGRSGWAARSSATGRKNSRRMTRVNSPGKKINSEIASGCQARIFATVGLFSRSGVSVTKRYPGVRLGDSSPTPLSSRDKNIRREESGCREAFRRIRTSANRERYRPRDRGKLLPHQTK